ncbi:MFS transporter [Actinoplanes sp. NPDC051851]|uniref:MFS transporter n=1 Tax=Actinoplanes sp. NPDC051851 TaxID=3154753 RepID=UPI003434AB9E
MSDDPTGPKNPDREVTESAEQATFRDIFALREYRAVFGSQLISWVGDYFSRAAVTVLVYQQTDSVLLSAASFATGYLAAIVAGPLLSSVAERYPYRRVMIASDLFRMVMIGLLLIPHLPAPAVLATLLLASFGGPPAQAARSALTPMIVGRERLSLALAAYQTAGQAAQVAGYLVGATVAVTLGPRAALGLDVLSFAASALLVTVAVADRPAALAPERRTHLLRETGEGYRLIFGEPALRSIAIVVFTVIVFSIVPESLAASWAAEGSAHGNQGLDQGAIMAASPLGWVIGGLLFSRLVPEARRVRLVPPLAVLTPLLLVPALLGPPIPVVVLLVLGCGMCVGALFPTLNATFVLLVPPSHRARAFGVVSSGIQASQFLAVIVTGGLADRFPLPRVVGLWSLGGALLMLAVALRWPRPERFALVREAATGTATPGTSTATEPEPSTTVAEVTPMPRVTPERS